MLTNIIIDLKEIMWEGVDWMHLTQDRDQWQTVVNRVINLQVKYMSWNLLNS
jgi:hypothetical protein